MAQTWYTTFILIGVFSFVLIPLAYFWYETDDEESMGQRICTTICWSSINLCVFVVFLMGLYFTVGYVELPVKVMQPYATGNITASSGFFPPTSKPPLWEDVAAAVPYDAIQQIRTSLVIYVLALLSFIGWMLMTIFGGIGMVALPMDLIAAFVNRPVAIDVKQWAERKLKLKNECQRLLADGKTKQEELKAKPNRWKERRFVNEFKKRVLDLEDEMEVLNLCYKKNAINPLVPWLQLFGGLFCWVITISWWFQLLFEIFLQGLAGPYLSDVFTKLSAAFPLFGIVAYGIFAFYILVCVIKGSIKFAGRFFLISIHPLKLNGTMMNSFLFNIGIILICSVSCTQLCTTAFRQFVHSSAISQIFVTQIQYLKFFSYFYSMDVPVFYSLLFAVSFLQLIWSCLCTFVCAKKQADNLNDMLRETRRERV